MFKRETFGGFTIITRLYEGPGETPPSKSLLELEAEYNEADLMKFLLDSHYTVKIENDKVAEISPKASNPDIFQNYNGVNVLNCLLSRANNLPIDILQRLFDKLKTSHYIVDEIVAALAECRCQLDRVLLLSDPRVTQQMLNFAYNKVPVVVGFALKQAMRSVDSDNLMVLLLCDTGTIGAKLRFIIELEKMLLDSRPNVELAKLLIKVMMRWNIRFDFRTFNSYFSRVFQSASAKVVRMLLDCQFDEYAKKSYGDYFLMYVFGNGKVDAVELLGNRSFDVNAEHNGNTALKLAVKCGSERNVRWLLDKGALLNHPQRDDKPLASAIKSRSREMIDLLLERGANMNDVGANGASALHVAKNVEMIKFLLIRGADARVLDQGNRTVFEGRGLPEWSMILAHLALLTMRRMLIITPVTNKIQSKLKFRHFWGKCRGQLRWMKTQKVYGSTTMFDVVCGKIGRVTRGMDVGGIKEKMLVSARDGEVDPYYVGLLADKFEDVVLVRELKRKAGLVISEAMVVFGADHLVIDKIIDFLTLQDLMVFE